MLALQVEENLENVDDRRWRCRGKGWRWAGKAVKYSSKLRPSMGDACLRLRLPCLLVSSSSAVVPVTRAVGWLSLGHGSVQHKDVPGYCHVNSLLGLRRLGRSSLLKSSLLPPYGVSRVCTVSDWARQVTRALVELGGHFLNAQWSINCDEITICATKLPACYLVLRYSRMWGCE